EPAHRALMQLYAQTGRRSAALRQYQLCLTTLRRELRTEPEPETQALHEEILRGGAPAGPVAARDPPTHRAEHIRASPRVLEDERKQVTVLVAALKGSMELLADRDPEDARKLLDPVLERMMQAVRRS